MIWLVLALSAALLAFGIWMGINAKSGPQCTMGVGLTFIGAIIFAALALIAGALVLSHAAHARDLGQWEAADPVVKEWYKSLMRPDAPTSSCCGESDAYWADDVHVRGGKTYAVITDDRDDGPLGRPHVPVGTEVEIPPEKLKWDRGNPTGHNVLFLSSYRYPFCFVTGSGT
jgi:hypothetical protein